MRILIVEDEVRIADFLQRGLRAEGHFCVVANDGEAGLSLALDGDFDLLLLDMMLPDGCGLDVLEAMGSDEADERPTTVVLTASQDPALRKRCEEMQVHDFMNKPVSEKDFMRVVRDHKKLMIHSTPMMPACA